MSTSTAAPLVLSERQGAVLLLTRSTRRRMTTRSTPS